MSAETPREWPAGPRGKWLTGHLTEFSSRPLEFLERCVREHGDFVPIRFLNKPAVILNDPAAIEEVLVTQSRSFTKMRGYDTPFVGRLFGNGLLTSDGATWLRQRKMMQPAFHRGKLSVYAPVIVHLAEKMIAEWKSNETRPTHADLTNLTGQVVIKAMFDCDVPPEIHDLEKASFETMESMSRPRTFWNLLTSFLPAPGARRFDGVMDRLDAFIYGLIKERRASGKDHGDILTMLLGARDEQGNGMSDTQLRDELTTLIAAGLDTTVLSLSWCCYLLARHPAVSERLENELRTVLKGRAPELADLATLKFTEATLKEAMRLYPPAWIMTREASADCVVGGYPIPRGTAIVISQWLKHRDGRIFDRPTEFDPSRWLDAPAIPKFAYFPFGGGPRMCIGSIFAMMEAPLGLATICRKFRFECDPSYEVKPWASITLQPNGGLHLRVRAHDG